MGSNKLGISPEMKKNRELREAIALLKEADLQLETATTKIQGLQALVLATESELEGEQTRARIRDNGYVAQIAELQERLDSSMAFNRRTIRDEEILKVINARLDALEAVHTAPEAEPQGLPIEAMGAGSEWALGLLERLAEFEDLEQAFRDIRIKASGYVAGDVTPAELGLELADIADPIMAMAKALVEWFADHEAPVVWT